MVPPQQHRLRVGGRYPTHVCLSVCLVALNSSYLGPYITRVVLVYLIPAACSVFNSLRASDLIVPKPPFCERRRQVIAPSWPPPKLSTCLFNVVSGSTLAVSWTFDDDDDDDRIIILFYHFPNYRLTYYLCPVRDDASVHESTGKGGDQVTQLR
jgi:hypothetical protein